MRTLCVWYPDWPLRRLEVLPDRPCLVVATDGSQVVAADLGSREAGVELGMSRREAESICPTASVFTRDIGEETRRFELVAQTVETLIPRVEVADPGLLFVPLGGAVRYYGGEEPLVERVAKELDGVDQGGARLGVADGPFAARWAAALADDDPLLVGDTPSFLSGLEVAALGWDDLAVVFRWLGVTTLGALASLPREALASRFGRPGLDAHRLASGEDRLPQPRVIPPELAVEGAYEDPLETLDQVGFAARALAARLIVGLQREGIAPHRVEVTATAADETSRTRVWRSVDPFTEGALADRVWWQLRAWMEQGSVSGGVVRLRLDPSDLSGQGSQLVLLEATAEGGWDGWHGIESTRMEVERALARAQALLGPEGVLMAGRQGGRLPAEQLRWRRWGEEDTVSVRDSSAPWPGTTPGPAPALVPPEPSVLEVEWDEGMPIRVRLGSRWEPVISWAGPWRLMGKWWRGEPAADRYQLVTSAAAFLVVVKEGRTFLAGIYD